MNYYALFPTITSLLFSFLGVYIFLKNPKSKLSRIFFLFCMALFVWLFSFSLIYWTQDNEHLAYIFAKIGFVGAVLFPVIFLHFVLVLLKHSYIRYINYLYGISLIFAIVGLFTNWFYIGVDEHFWGYYPVAGKLYFLIILQVVFIVCLVVKLLVKYLKDPNVDAFRKEQVKYLLIGVLACSLGVCDYLSKFETVSIYPYAYIILFILTIIIAICMLKTNLISVKLAVTNTGLFIMLYCVVIGVPIYIGYRTQQWFLATIIIFVLATIGPAILRYLQIKTEKFLMSSEQKYQDFLLKAAKGMMDQYELVKLSKLIVKMISKVVDINYVAMFIYDEDKEEFYCVSYKGNFIKDINIRFHKNAQIINFIQAKASPFLLSNINDNFNKLVNEISYNISLIVPCVIKKNLIAFFTLGNKNNRSIYSRRDLEVFKTLSSQVAVAIENCMFFNRTAKQQQILFETEKLLSVGSMSAGLSCQIKTILNQFAMVGEELKFEMKKFSSENSDFVEKNEEISKMVSYINEMSDSVISNVKKTNSIVQDMSNFAKPTQDDETFTKFSFGCMLEQIINLLKLKYQKEYIPISFELPKKDVIYAIKSQIQKVIYNCLDNACESILEKNTLINKSLLEQKDKKILIEKYEPKINVELKFVDRFMKIYIQDNGVGIKDEDLNKMFSPFFTTKYHERKGFGIGMYIVKKIVEENHNGKIEFKSQYKQGTTFSITLPMAKIDLFNE